MVSVVVLLIASHAQAQQLIVDFPGNFELITTDINFVGVEGRVVGLPQGGVDELVTIYANIDCISQGCTPTPYYAVVASDGSFSESIMLRDGRSRIGFYFRGPAPGAIGQSIEVDVYARQYLPTYSNTSVGIRWAAGWEEGVREMAAGTLSPRTWQSTDDAVFMKYVQDRVLELVTGALDYPSITVSEINGEQSADVVLQLVPENKGKFGWVQAANCARATSNAEVYLGYFVESMAGRVSRWPPMRLNDSADERKEDIAFALADTAVHEITHSLGLVTCDWMPRYYRDYFHNAIYPASLHGNGGFRMAAGPRVKKYLRLGYRTPSRGGAPIRRLREINQLNRNFLEHVYGTP